MTREPNLRRWTALLTGFVTTAALAGCSGEQRSAADHDADAGLVAAAVDRDAGDPGRIDAVVDGMDQLAGILYEPLSATPGNLALSPYSAATALAMTSNGAEGETQQQMLAALGVDDVASLNSGLNALTRQLEELNREVDEDGDGEPDGEIELAAANSLFGQDDVNWAEPFLEALARDFGAGMRTVDFKSDAPGARTTINAWTAEQTRDRIKELIGEDVLDELSRLVLVNALYLKAPWAEEFSPAGDRDFTVDADTTVTAPMISTTLSGSYRATDDWQSVTVPYLGDQLAMTIVLPDVGRQQAVEQQIADGDLGAMLDGDASPTVSLTMPTWEFRTAADLKEPLKQAGMTRPFSDEAEFAPMTAADNAALDRDLHIDDVLQQSFIAVDEHGTEAAAATAVVMGAESAPQQEEPIRMLCDRPFLFVIHDVEHGTPLFLGRVADPTA